MHQVSPVRPALWPPAWSGGQGGGTAASQGLGIVWWIPLAVSAALSAASAGAQVWIARNRASGAQKVGATNIVNGVEQRMAENLAAWQKSAKSAAEQRLALETWDKLWAYLVSPEGCGNAALGEAGTRCIAERAPGCRQETYGVCWDYQQLYRDPIAQDPAVQPEAGSAHTTTLPGDRGALATGLQLPTPVLLAVLLVVVSVLMGDRS